MMRSLLGQIIKCGQRPVTFIGLLLLFGWLQLGVIRSNSLESYRSTQLTIPVIAATDEQVSFGAPPELPSDFVAIYDPASPSYHYFNDHLSDNQPDVWTPSWYDWSTQPSLL